MQPIKIVANKSTAEKFIQKAGMQQYSLFLVTTYGYKADGKTISSNVIQGRKYELFTQQLEEYPNELRVNQKAQKI
jgi:hypothetical protein